MNKLADQFKHYLRLFQEEDSAKGSSLQKRTGGTIKDDDTWTDGDFEIISADNVRFRVPSYYLFASR